MAHNNLIGYNTVQKRLFTLFNFWYKMCCGYLQIMKTGMTIYVTLTL